MKSGKLVDIKNQQTETEKERILILPTDALHNSDVIELGLEITNSETEMFLRRNSRCVSVDTTLSAPLGRSEKRVFKGKGDLVKFRCSIYEKKLLKVKAARCGLTLSEYFRRVALEQDITERFTDEHIELYKMLIKYHNNFKSIGNMFKKRNPKLMESVHELANEIKDHLKKFQE